MLQITDIILYIVAAVVIYCFAGVKVESPALGSAGPLISKVAYGLAIPTVRMPLLHRLLCLLIVTDCHCRRDLWPYLRQIHLCPLL